MKRYFCWLALSLLLIAAEASLALSQEAAKAGDSRQANTGPVFSSTGPDAELYGAAAGFPAGDRLIYSGFLPAVDQLIGSLSRNSHNVFFIFTGE